MENDYNNSVSLKTKDNRLNEIDIAKGLAIIFVVCEHILANTTSQTSILINYIHMPVFFFISGFFLSGELKKCSLAEFTLKKGKRLLLPYLIWSMISFIINIAMTILSGNIISLNSIKAEAVNIFIYSRSVWFLIVLFITLELICLIYQIRKRLDTSFYVLSLLIYTVLLLLPINEYFSIYKFKWLFTFILIGLWIGNGRKQILYSPKFKVTGAVCGIVLLLIMVYAGVNNIAAFNIFSNLSFNTISISNIKIGVIQYLAGLSGMFFILWISKLLASTAFKKFLSLLGYYSLDIYVTHMFIIFLIKYIPIPKTNGIVWIFISLLAATVISFAISLIAKYILRRSKLYCLSVGAKNK